MRQIRWSKKLLLFAPLCGALIFIWIFTKGQTGVPEDSINKYSSEEMPAAEIMLGQNFIIGIPGPEIDETTGKILRDIKPGGIVLYRRNYQSPEQFKSLISSLQQIAREENVDPFFIMIDEEPGGASRLDLLRDVFTLGLPEWDKIAVGIQTLKELGVNVELAPVADFPFNEDSFIKKRVPAKTTEDLIAFNRAFIELLKENDISATLKHFPGAGVFVEDPHKTVPSEYVNEDFFNQSISLFKSGINDGASFVMTNHAIYENIDKDNPATLSYSIITDLLKNQLGFKGIIITDDIEDMLSPVWGIDPVDAGVRALKAGNIMIMYSQNIENTGKTFKQIEDIVKKDSELKDIVKKNYQQITEFKNYNN